MISGADPGFGNGGARFLAKRVTYTSEASIHQLGGGAFRVPRKHFEFRTPQSESERNLTNYFIIFLLLFY